ncbi:NAD(P)/FAD-dependent oxidoreductase [Streptomyces sp. NPDC005438]|uniref:NAD(P)/FAD-dependent oxidoreductase n=1 Tax=Streptomyces sp. NPDC005438 TaxID=3156880 RepID=UPI0033A1C2EB
MTYETRDPAHHRTQNPDHRAGHLLPPAPEGGWDVVVVGGGPAGLSAALTLARVRRSVLVIDAGSPRNAPASAAHGLLGRDGVPPLELLRRGREEVTSYGARIATARVEEVRRHRGGFRVRVEGGEHTTARRLLVTTGLVDRLPEVPGLAERWGRDVVHCVHCHGWEARDTAVGVLHTSPHAYHQALMFRGLTSRLTFLRHTGEELPEERRDRLDRLGVDLVDGEVTGLEVDGEDRLAGVRLASGRTVPLRTLVVVPLFVARAPLLDDLGLTPAAHPMGSHLVTDPQGFTGAWGVWAAGNVTDLTANVSMAIAAGSRAGGAMLMDLITEEVGADGPTAPPPFSAAEEAELHRRRGDERRHGLTV